MKHDKGMLSKSQLFEELTAAENLIADLRKKVAERDVEISVLRQTLERLKTEAADLKDISFKDEKKLITEQETVFESAEVTEDISAEKADDNFETDHTLSEEEIDAEETAVIGNTSDQDKAALDGLMTVEEISEKGFIVSDETVFPEESDLIEKTETEVDVSNRSNNSYKTFSPDIKYGASVIGKIVVSAAKYCNSLTAVYGSENVKELVNLILGRTEIAKSEILNIITTDLSDEDKSAKIDSQLTEAEDYFKSVAAQIN